MKTIIRKAVAVGASVLLAGMSMGMATAANYPSPFLDGNVAVVYGTGAGVSITDQVQAQTINIDLTARGGTSTSGSTVSVSGESYLYEKAQNKLTIGKGTLDVVSTSLDDGELPNLLKKGKYRDNDNDEFDFSQTIVVANQTLELFDDNDYKEDTPTMGIKIAGNTKVLNYTLDFTDNPLWNDLSNSNINLLGKQYYISQTNTTSGSISMTLLDSSAKITLQAGETKSVMVNGINYEVTPAVFDTSDSKVSLIVNGGEPTNLLSSGNVESLGNDVYIGVESVVANAYAGGTQYVEISLGSGKLELINGQQIKINDDTVDGMTSEITLSTNSLDRINIVWSTGSDEGFVTEDSEVVMPAFSAIKLMYAGLEKTAEEELKVVDGNSDYLKLDDFPLEKGLVDIPLLYFNDSNFTIIGKDGDEKVLTSSLSTVTYNASSNHEYMVATWATTNDAESYILRATSFANENSYATNKTTIQYLADGNWNDLETVGYSASSTTDEISVGSLVLTTGAINYAAKTVVISAGTGVNFNTLYSKEGMKVTLPTTNTTATTYAITTPTTAGAACAVTTGGSDTIYNGLVTYNNSAGDLNVSATTACNNGPNTYSLVFSEEDRTGNLGTGANITLTLGGEGTSNEVSAYDTTISSDRGGESNRFQTGDNTKIYVSYVESDLGTKVLEDETSTDRETVTLTYNGGETYGNFYVADADSTVSGTTSTGGTAAAIGNVVYKDSEKASWQAMNVIVVGGSCINSAAATALGFTGATCAEDFTAATGVGSGQFLIQSVGDAFTTGKIALVVAGYEMDDTRNAATYLTTKPVDTAAGKKYIGTSATTAELSVA